MTRAARMVAALLLAGAASAASAQTMLDQEQRLIDIHSLLLDLPPVGPPGALRAGQLSLGVEGIVIPLIDGTTGGKRQITASDRTRLFPRPRIAAGLPLPERLRDLRAFVGLAYIPPISIREVSTHYGAVEAGLAWTHGALRLGARGHALYATSRAPVTDPATRDTLDTHEYGADLAAGWTFGLPLGSVTPYAGAGVTHLDGRFRVTSDGVVLRSQHTGAALNAGLRLLLRDRWEGAVEVDGYPGRLVHTIFRLAWIFDLMPG